MGCWSLAPPDAASVSRESVGSCLSPLPSVLTSFFYYDDNSAPQLVFWLFREERVELNRSKVGQGFISFSLQFVLNNGNVKDTSRYKLVKRQCVLTNKAAV